MKFTESPRVSVPWLLLAKNPEEYIDSDCFPEGFLIRDPSKLTKSNVNKLWRHWEQRSKNRDVIVRFIKAKPDDMRATLIDKPKRTKRRKLDYVEIGDTSDEESDADEGSDDDVGVGPSSSRPAKGKPVSSRPAPRIKADPSSPVANKDDRLTFLRGLSADPRYVGLLDRLSRLPIHVSNILHCSNFCTK